MYSPPGPHCSLGEVTCFSKPLFRKELPAGVGFRSVLCWPSEIGVTTVIGQTKEVQREG